LRVSQVNFSDSRFRFRHDVEVALSRH
jgi:hypothetical protein